MREIFLSQGALILYALLLLAAYVAGHILSRKTECVVLYKKFDAWAIVIHGWSNIALCIITGLLQDEVNHPAILLCVVNVGFFVTFVTTSVIANLGHGRMSILYILVSITSKVLLMLLSCIISILLLSAMNSGTKDARYRDGTRKNGRTANLWKFFDIFNFLIFNLVKPEDDKWDFVGEIFKRAGAIYDD